jgi:hypothetical protein
MRGIALSGTDPAAALADFLQAIRLRTQTIWPYVFASRQLLEQGELTEALRVANLAINNDVPGPEVARALLHECQGVCYALLGQPNDMIMLAFDRALDLDPLNESIRRNREVARTDYAQLSTEVPFRFQRRASIEAARREVTDVRRRQILEADQSDQMSHLLATA